MKPKLLLIILFSRLILSGLSVHAQGQFEKTFGGISIDAAYSLAQTTDGGYIMAGNTSSIGAGSGDIMLLKTNSNGDTMWTRSYGGSSDESAAAVRQTTDGGYIVFGSTTSFGAGLWDTYLVKTNAAGDTIWTKTYGGADQDYGIDVKQTTDGGYILTGIRNNPVGFDNDIFLTKTDSAGAMLWTKVYAETNHDEGYCVQPTGDGGYIIAGTTINGSSDICLIKTDASGDTLWTKKYAGGDADYVYSVEQTTDSGYMISGETLSFGAGSWDVYLIKTNFAGDTLWTKTYGGTSVEYGRFAHQTSDGGYIIGGSTLSFGAGSYDYYLIKTNTTGDTLWTKTYGGTGEEMGYDARQTADGGYIISGYSQSFGAGAIDVYLVKTDANGNTFCHQSNTLTAVSAMAAQISYAPLNISSIVPIIQSTLTIINSGIPVNSICPNGINEMGMEGPFISIYPNPTRGQFNISASLAIDEIIITGLLGQLIYQAKPDGKVVSFNIEESGTYFIKITSDKQIITKKLIVCK